jgi:hypothetical protein
MKVHHRSRTVWYRAIQGNLPTGSVLSLLFSHHFPAGIDTEIFPPHSISRASSTKTIQKGHRIEVVKIHAYWSLKADKFDRCYLKSITRRVKVPRSHRQFLLIIDILSDALGRRSLRKWKFSMTALSRLQFNFGWVKRLTLYPFSLFASLATMKNCKYI